MKNAAVLFTQQNDHCCATVISHQKLLPFKMPRALIRNIHCACVQGHLFTSVNDRQELISLLITRGSRIVENVRCALNGLHVCIEQTTHKVLLYLPCSE